MYGVYGQVYAADGTTEGDEFLINSYTTNYQDAPSVTDLVGGGFAVTWTSNGPDGNSYGVFGRLYTPDTVIGYGGVGGDYYNAASDLVFIATSGGTFNLFNTQGSIATIIGGADTDQSIFLGSVGFSGVTLHGIESLASRQLGSMP
ncbi:MAG: hypothetical protein HQL39_20515 [Alphaproteobacteria bacterium]|nr:hypothetical protein [Alphaproteobacteria bacterium]